jgi:hypothetical protein
MFLQARVAARFEERQKAKASRAQYFQDKVEEKELLEKMLKDQHKAELVDRLHTFEARAAQAALEEEASSVRA